MEDEFGDFQADNTNHVLAGQVEQDLFGELQDAEEPDKTGEAEQDFGDFQESDLGAKKVNYDFFDQKSPTDVENIETNPVEKAAEKKSSNVKNLEDILDFLDPLQEKKKTVVNVE